MKLYADSQEDSFSLFRRGISASSLSPVPPAAIKPPGLDTARQWYLYNNIRQFVPDRNKDVLCPQPREDTLQTSEPTPSPPGIGRPQRRVSASPASSSEREPVVTGGHTRARSRGACRSRGSRRGAKSAASTVAATDEHDDGSVLECALSASPSEGEPVVRGGRTRAQRRGARRSRGSRQE